MGLFDFLRPKTVAVPPSLPPRAPRSDGPRFPVVRERMFDLSLTRRLEALFHIPAPQRDDGWHDDFFDTMWNASVELADPQEFTGPDGFRYLRLNVPRPDAPFESQSLANLARICVERGSGAAFFASPDDPADAAQYVFSLGKLDSLLRYDSWNGDPVDEAESAGLQGGHRATILTEAHRIMTGAPSADFLPPPVAQALAGYMTGTLGITDPRVQLLVDAKLRPTRNLVIGIRRSQYESEQDVADAMQRLFWYMPPLRSLMLMPEDWSESDMTRLADLSAR
ncbi:hypothetical protein [Sphingobium boeckii]|uniref:Uncharacterized protein n=1 Tax=Sphingobium boeckii TaxID=1082345 RepID=A0A7W9EDI7_9SPHN|nr:hypothetical protein [Sphingobium boeckii]MBB5684020.1 hypothetical protein [Sphingobium boeckii]